MPSRALEREAAIENPRRGRRAKKRNDASAVAIPVQSPYEQLQHARVDDKTDKSADAKRQQLFQARFFHGSISSREHRFHFLRRRMLDHAALGHDGVDEIGGRHVEHGIPRFRTVDDVTRIRADTEQFIRMT